MLLGHYAVAFAAKRAAPRTSLGLLAFAAQWLDELWPILLLAGVERVRIVPGLMRVNDMDFVHYPYSHSLLMAIVWALLIGALYFAIRRYRRGAYVVAALVLSHWVLDAPMHRPDLPLWPGSDALVGFGLWNSVPVTLVLEIGLLCIGVFMYVRCTRPLDRIGSVGLACLVGVLLLMYLGGTFVAPAANEGSLALSALGLWLFVPVTYWIDRHRTPIGPPAMKETDAPVA
jgi:membrane-bound metal-dependent hydrolase YbcI (DUF457 family)